MRIDGKCGKITRLITDKSGRIETHSVEMKLDDGMMITIGVGYLACTKKFNKMTSAQMHKVCSKPFHGHKLGEHVCISTEEPLYR
jgi:hypothetical protein